MTKRLALVVSGALLLSGGALLAQHSFTPEEVAEGGRLYAANCASCHGAKGNTLPNAEVMTGKFKRATSDDDLSKLVRNGIPNSAMVAERNLTDMQSAQIVAYLRSMALPGAVAVATPVPALPAGDAVRGKALFEGAAKGNCLSCHRVGSNGSGFGPDLSSIGAPRGGGARGGAAGGAGAAGPAGRGAAPPLPNAASAAAPGAGANPQTLAQKLLDPNANVPIASRHVRLVEKNGNVVVGRLLNEDTFSFQIFDSKEKLATYQKSALKEFTYATPMPSYRDKLSLQELSDVIAYLGSLRGN